jgi:hypothetical protein
MTVLSWVLIRWQFELFLFVHLQNTSARPADATMRGRGSSDSGDSVSPEGFIGKLSLHALSKLPFFQAVNKYFAFAQTVF